MCYRFRTKIKPTTTDITAAHTMHSLCNVYLTRSQKVPPPKIKIKHKFQLKWESSNRKLSAYKIFACGIARQIHKARKERKENAIKEN